jgi:hypothetical protein
MWQSSGDLPWHFINTVCDTLILVVVIYFIAFMQGIYNYKPETKHVSRVYSVAAFLYLHFVLHVMLFHP